MPGKFYPVSLRNLLSLVLKELSKEGSIFGIPQELFYAAGNNKVLETDIFGHVLHSPIGVAAGPHTQMAQNIVAAWLMGSRYIELKTVQTLDELDIPRPCIDMQDEGYNCEWSQELTIRESFNEYLNAWILIHILNHRFGWSDETGTVFNMSVGYDLRGIMNDNVQWFLDKMGDCTEELSARIDEISDIYPDVYDLDIPPVISDNITLSTMHGCPPDEIGDIAAYLMGKRKLHTLVKLNPTLLGPEVLRDILNRQLSFRTVVPDEAFAHDLKYPDAVRIIRTSQGIAAENSLHFGLKLTNTLESVNNKDIFGSDIAMMYMSGRALHPLSVNLAHRLQDDFNGQLLLSFAGGADAFNIDRLISCGFRTVTVCSDLLKPGGYMRLSQYFMNLSEALRKHDALSIEDFILASSEVKERTRAILFNLSGYSKEVLATARYKRDYIRPPDIRTKRELGSFDCISAPCRDTCATGQDVPDYLWYASKGQFDRAFEVVLRTNPFPSVTGMICDHLCQGKCTRINYDDPLRIREVKRFISGQHGLKLITSPENGLRAAVIGAGPAGLSCAFYLRMAGFSVDVFETKSEAGGMVHYAIPGFRLTGESVARDIKRITDLGVRITYNTCIDREKFAVLRREYSYIFIGTGAQLTAPLNVDGADAEGVTDPLEFLFKARDLQKTVTGKKIVIIGGGNTAMDAARTAHRLAGKDGSVTIVYRRTINEMPADQGEIKEVIKEGVEIIELAAPEKIIHDKGRVTALLCSRMELKGLDKTGRPAPVKIADSEFEIPCDTVIPAIGQLTDIDFATAEELAAGGTAGKTRLEKVYIGGDAMRGASTAINAIADGRKAAEQIISDAAISFSNPKPVAERGLSKKELLIKRAVRSYSTPEAEHTDEERLTFSLISQPQDRESIMHESERCLWCDEMCSICTTVCPNFANRIYEVNPCSIPLQKAVRTDQGEIIYKDDGVFEIRQKYQVMNIADFCNECGNCKTFCPTSGTPWKDKPRLHLTTESFNNSDEGYFLSVLSNRKTLAYKQERNFTTLTELADNYLYETDFITATFSKTPFTLKDASFTTPCVKEAHFRRATEMMILLNGACSLSQV